MNINLTRFPTLQTERLLLRKLSPEDDKEIYFLRSDEGVNKYIDRPGAASLEDAHNFINKTNHSIENNKCIDWAITFKDDPGLIGTICFWNLSSVENKAEVGYELLPSFQRKGITREALATVLDIGFTTMLLAKIEGYMHKENSASIKLLENFNFKRDKDAESKIDRAVDPNNVVCSLYKIT